jgi:hypothetical protein
MQEVSRAVPGNLLDLRFAGENRKRDSHFPNKLKCLNLTSTMFTKQLAMNSLVTVPKTT